MFLKNTRGKLKILIISESVHRVGGVEKYSLDLAAAFGERMGTQNILLISIPVYGSSLLRKISALLVLFYNCWRFNPDYIVCGYIYLISYVIIAARIFRVPYLVCTYGIEVWRDLPPWQIQALKNAAKVLTISRYTKEKLIRKGIDEKKIFLIHPLIDIDRFGNVCGREKVRLARNLNGRKIVLTVGRMASGERYKGHDELIGAMPEIIKNIPETVLLIVGSGDDVKRLKELCKSLRLTDNVIFAGEVSDDELPFYYSFCDVFVMPSRVIRKKDGKWGGEGFGIVFLEASASGKPVIGANSGGITDAVADGVTGLLVNPEDQESLCGTILKLLKDKEYADSLGRNGKEWVKKFDIKLLPDLVETLIKDLNKEEKCAA